MESPATEIATLGGGCFWCLEAVFEQLNGVERVQSGYAGGQGANPSYELVCTGTTGHAEVVQVHFDPNVISFKDILNVFFTIHDPTTLNRQGADAGSQYRSAVFFHSAAQEQTTRNVIRELADTNIWPDPIVTEVATLDAFYPAEAYHHEYYRRNADQPYCRAVIEPKVAKLRQQFFQKLKKSPAARD